LRGRASVAVLEPDDASPLRFVPRHAVPNNASNHRVGPFVGIVAAHASVVWAVIAAPGESVRAPKTESFVAVLVRPRVIVSQDPIALPPSVRVPKDAPLAYGAPIPEINRPTITVIGVGTRAPHPADASVDATPFVRQAGLRPGEGATVVVRLEVLETGDVGQVEIDVSGGTPEIDRAAIAYAKSWPWTGGLIDGKPATIWVRWGVRLQA
jgi:TonB family protein